MGVVYNIIKDTETYKYIGITAKAVSIIVFLFWNKGYN